MMEKTVFHNSIVYWVLAVSLIGGLLLSGYALVTGFNILVSLRVIWMAALLFLVLTKHKYALANLKWWLIISFIAGPALSLAGRFLNEMLDNFSSFSVEFYLYNASLLVVGLILFNYIRSTVTVERVEAR
ncbi:hypothetical protein [Hymenobacter sp. HDW8]|uniref:hypothetical protein n=1 Tax=Hymenobacter sp. HDW8 TaxID=2714932 RepID=UPI00140CC2E7|nr:hypothetical protein [Hymenobacter sp. HDW8]QIL75746.1 hypothetical protein G7064_07685 [Hymenobacter sp. HDW8]